MKRLMKNAASESLLIPRPTPETVEIVAIVVIHQIPMTYMNKKIVNYRLNFIPSRENDNNKNDHILIVMYKCC